MASSFGFMNSGMLVAVVSVVVASGIIAVIMNRRKARSKILKDPDEQYELKLVDKKILTDDTRRFRFALPQADAILGLPVGQHVFLSATIDGKLLARAYTPISSDDLVGFVDFVIKIYFKNVHQKFPDGGRMTQYLDSLRINDTIHVRGPNGRLVYEGRGKFSIRPNKKSAPAPVHAKRVGMIAGGSGITPMYQLITAVLSDPLDNTHLSLLFANKSTDDLLLHDELQQLRFKYPERFDLWYTVDTVGAMRDWKYSTGFVNENMIREHLPPPGKDVFILVCGSLSMVNNAVIPSLKSCGYSPESYFVY